MWGHTDPAFLLFNFQGSQDPGKQSQEYGGVAQLGEHLPCKQGVKGSNPFISTRSAKRTMNIEVTWT